MYFASYSLEPNIPFWFIKIWLGCASSKHGGTRDEAPDLQGSTWGRGGFEACFPPAIWEENGGIWKLANSTWKFLDHARIVFLKRDFWNQDLKNLGSWGGKSHLNFGDSMEHRRVKPQCWRSLGVRVLGKFYIILLWVQPAHWNYVTDNVTFILLKGSPLKHVSQGRQEGLTSFDVLKVRNIVARWVLNKWLDDWLEEPPAVHCIDQGRTLPKLILTWQTYYHWRFWTRSTESHATGMVWNLISI